MKKLLLPFFIVFMDMVSFAFVIPLIPDYVERFGGSAGIVGLLLSAYALGQFFAAPILGRLSDRFGRKPLLLLSIGGTSAALLLLGLAPSLPWLFASRILDGLTGGNITIAQSYIADVTDEKTRAWGLGLIGAAFGLGFIVGPLFGGFLVRFGLSTPAFVAAGIALVNIGLIATLLPESLPVAEREKMKANPLRRFSLKLLWDALRSKDVGPFLHALLFSALGFGVFQNIFSAHAQQALGLDAGTRSLVLAYVGVLVAGVQGGLIGPLVKRFSEKRLAFLAAPVLALSLLGWAFAPNLAVLLVVLVPMSASAAVLTVTLKSLLSQSVPREELGGTLGLASALDSLVRIVAPLLGGFLLARVGAWAPGVFAAAVLLWVAWFFYRKIVRARPSSS